MSRYLNPHRGVDLTGYLKAGDASEESDEDKKKEGGADFWDFIGDIAPTAGSVIGGGIGLAASGGNPLGAAAGATIGGGIGGIGGQMAHSYADSQTAPREDELHAEEDKQMRKRELLNTLMGLRR